MMMPMLTRRHFTAAAGATLAASQPADAARGPGRPDPFVLNDASRLNPVAVVRKAVLQPQSDEALIAALRTLLRHAATEGRPVCVGGARHSMGGQSLMRGGFAASLAAPIQGSRSSSSRSAATIRSCGFGT
jgi:hypothetical protein